MKFSLATWNVNSIRSRVNLVKRFAETYRPDILCLQEIKCTNDQFPFRAMENLGFKYIELNGQKAYHGVATLSRFPLERIEARDFNGSGDARHLAVGLPGMNLTHGPVILHNFYVPAGGDIADISQNPKFGQKLDFLSEMERWSAGGGLDRHASHILVGDLNVAPLESDVWSHKQLLRVVSHTPVEVEHMEKLRAAHAWVDVMRDHVPPDEVLFTWWSYRARDWRQSNRGRRLDHVWVSPQLQGASRSMRVVDEARDWEKPSDHAPVLVEFDLG